MHLHKLSVPESLFGAIFAIPTVTFILSMFIVINSPFDKRTTTICGFFFMIVSNLLIGPWEYTFLPKNFIVCAIGLGIFGFGVCASKIPAVTISLELAQEKYHHSYDRQSISDTVSAVSNSVTFITEIIAPPLSGLLEDSFGFENAQALLAASIAILLIVMIMDRISYPDSSKQGIENKELLERLKE